MDYPFKKFIFINCQYNDTIIIINLRKEYNEVYRLLNNKNIYVIDVNNIQLWL